MAAALAALADHRVAAGLLGLDRVFHGAADDHHLEAGLFELFHDRHRHPEPRDKTGRAFADDDINGLGERFRRGREQVHAERL